MLELRYGERILRLSEDLPKYSVIGGTGITRDTLSDAEIGMRFDSPIGSPELEEMVGGGGPVLFVVPDATRHVAAGRLVDLAIRRLIAAGVAPFDISIIFATGVHRPVTPQERSAILSPFIVQRIKTLDHNPRDLANLVRLGETSGGISVESNRALLDAGTIIPIGGIGFHYFAGFTGGRKMICPGLASSRTITRTHSLAFDPETKDRRTGVGPGMLSGNLVHEAFVEAASFVEKKAFSINVIMNDDHDIANVYCGGIGDSHIAACEEFAAEHSVSVEGKRNLVIASCGGFPHDIDLIQAHKTLETASRICAEGGTIILLAECRSGLGRGELLRWFDAENSVRIAEKLCEKYQVAGQTAWSILRIAERFNIVAVTELSESELGKMRISKAVSLSDALKKAGNASSAYVLPFGTRYLPTV